MGRDAGDGGISWDQVSHADGQAVEVPGWIAGLRNPGRRRSALTCLLEPIGSWRDARTIGGRIYELEERGLPETLDQLTSGSRQPSPENGRNTNPALLPPAAISTRSGAARAVTLTGRLASIAAARRGYQGMFAPLASQVSPVMAPRAVACPCMFMHRRTGGSASGSA